MHRERYMDNTASLRAIGSAIEQMQEGDSFMRAGKYAEARDHYSDALRKAPGDYAAYLMMTKCLISLKDYSLARRYAQEAKEVYPG